MLSSVYTHKAFPTQGIYPYGADQINPLYLSMIQNLLHYKLQMKNTEPYISSVCTCSVPYVQYSLSAAICLSNNGVLYKSTVMHANGHSHCVYIQEEYLLLDNAGIIVCDEPHTISSLIKQLMNIRMAVLHHMYCSFTGDAETSSDPFASTSGMYKS